MAPHVGLLTAPAAQIALAAIFGIMLLHERLRMGQWLGLVLGVTGVALVVGEAAVESVARFQGLVLAFVGVLGLVAGTLYFGRFCRGVPLLPGATAQFLSAAAVASLGAWLWKRLMRIGRGLLSQPLLGTPSWFLFQTNRGNLHVDGSLHVIRLRRTTLWHFNAGSGRRPPHQ